MRNEALIIKREEVVACKRRMVLDSEGHRERPEKRKGEAIGTKKIFEDLKLFSVVGRGALFGDSLLQQESCVWPPHGTPETVLQQDVFPREGTGKAAVAPSKTRIMPRPTTFFISLK